MGLFAGFQEERLPPRVRLYRGKVRDVLDYGSYLSLTATDRISAFDRVLGLVPEKGEILHQLSLFWFQQTQDIVPNALVGSLGPRTALMRKAEPLPVEIIVRGYLAGSVLRDYEGARRLWGIPPGLEPNQILPRPFLTPTTKSTTGHDQPIGTADIVDRGLVPARVWSQVEELAIRLFQRGQELLKRRGLILVDTKYELGVWNGQLVLIDEVHTPDSSRFWYADDYDAALAEGRPPRQLDKEVLRAWLLTRGWKGEGTPPDVPLEVLDQVRSRYLEAWRGITGWEFVPSAWTAEDIESGVLRWHPSD